MGDCQTDHPPYPLARLVSKHTPSARTQSTWGTKKSLICGMCSGPPRYYNLLNRQAGRPLNLPLPEQPGFSLASGGGSVPSGPELWAPQTNSAITEFQEVRLITFNTNILHLSDTPIPLTGV